jgi:glycosyltransferase involved in cell wall biosynthesis
MAPAITVYVPCYDAAPYLDRVLPALQGQTLPAAEVLVVDDGSRDDTVAIAERHGVRVVRHARNRGLSAARNTGFREAKTDFVAAVDADVEARPEWLERLAARIASDERIAGVGGSLLETVVSGADRWRAVHMRQSWGESPLDEARFLFGANTLFRRAAVLEVGGYDEHHRTNGEDGYISRRLQQAGYRLAYEPTAVCQHLREDDFASVSRTAWNWRFAQDRERGLAATLSRQRKIGRKLRRYLREDLRAGRWELAGLDVRMYFDWERRNWAEWRARRGAEAPAPGGD